MACLSIYVGFLLCPNKNLCEEEKAILGFFGVVLPLVASAFLYCTILVSFSHSDRITVRRIDVKISCICGLGVFPGQSTSLFKTEDDGGHVGTKLHTS